MNILIASSIDQKAIDELKQQHDVICAFNASEDELIEKIPDREVLIFRSGVQISAAVMQAAPELKLLIRAGSGLDNIDMEYVRQNGLELIRIPQPGARAVAELTFGLMLALSRKLVLAHQLWSQGRWVKKEMNGHLIRDKVLGVVGLGNIGSKVAQLGIAWGMQAIGCVEHFSPERTAAFKEKGIELLSFDAVIRRADIVSMHVPRKESTRYMINAETLANFKPGAFFINIARGGVVQESAIKQALQDGRLKGAALDVHENEGEGKISPLAGLPNVVLTPHIGAMALEAQQEIGQRILQIVHEHETAEVAV